LKTILHVYHPNRHLKLVIRSMGVTEHKEKMRYNIYMYTPVVEK